MIRKILFAILFLISEISEAEVKELTCSYGIKFWYSRDNSDPLINIVVTFKNCGSAHMDKTKTSVPNLFVVTIFCGCGSYSKEEFQEKTEDISAIFYGHSNFDNVLFFFEYPKIVSAEATNLIQTFFSSPKFPKAEIEKMKNAISYRLENYQVAPISWCENVLFPKLLFKNHPYGDSVATSENVLKLNDADLKSFHKKYIVRSNVELCIFGDISEKEAVKLADQILSSIPKGEKAQDNIPDTKPTLENFSEKYYIEGPQSYIVFALPNILKNPEQKFAASVLYLIFGDGGFRSYIIKKLRSELGLIYYGGVSKIEKKHSCFEIGLLQTSNNNTAAAVDSIKSLLKNLKEKGISQKELDFAKNNIKGKFLVNLRTSRDLCNFYIMKKLQGHSTNALDEVLRGIDAVTLDQVNSLANQILDEENIPIVIVGGNE
ncbi:MAG: insulinase family protein [Alphaproteobacteria bacterium]|nr:insulinase family protein [Alphaproteobacteria bacterium]